jgi:hypothetical protein
MPDSLSIPEIKSKLLSTSKNFSDYCVCLSDEQFFYQPEGKWSAAQQVRHLIKSTDTARLAFILPRFIVRWIGGKPNRHSRSYEELVNKYRLKLEQGGKASGRYIPKPIPPEYGKEKLVGSFTRSMEKFASAVERRWKDEQTDRYLAPHPLLGKITLRELCYFTIHHAEHHLSTISNMQNRSH